MDFIGNTDTKLVLLCVLKDNPAEVAIELEIAKEYYDGYKLNYDVIDVAFIKGYVDVTKINDKFMEVNYIKGMEAVYHEVLYIGMPDEVMEMFSDDIEKKAMLYKENDNVMIESISLRYIANYSEESKFAKKENAELYIDRYLDDLKEKLNDDDVLTVENIKRGLNLLRKKLWPE